MLKRKSRLSGLARGRGRVAAEHVLVKDEEPSAFVESSDLRQVVGEIEARHSDEQNKKKHKVSEKTRARALHREADQLYSKELLACGRLDWPSVAASDPLQVDAPTAGQVREIHLPRSGGGLRGRRLGCRARPRRRAHQSALAEREALGPRRSIQRLRPSHRQAARTEETRPGRRPVREDAVRREDPQRPRGLDQGAQGHRTNPSEIWPFGRVAEALAEARPGAPIGEARLSRFLRLLYGTQ
ncbi:unnamed protein product [Trichogramma brassicae]|uniref:Uncharacterized protein n=1 Tax=Trichogramma brassicae TaxID=86971 RepID=A0A6H5I6A3_9HYME|nr:unnamed protein product [Trichogramma brassicae]